MMAHTYSAYSTPGIVIDIFLYTYIYFFNFFFHVKYSIYNSEVKIAIYGNSETV